MATFVNVAAFCRLTGIGVIVYKRGFGGTLSTQWAEKGKVKKDSANDLRVLYNGIHFDLLRKGVAKRNASELLAEERPKKGAKK